MTRLATLLAAALLAGCSASAARTLALNSLIGQSDHVALQRLGPPTGTLEQDGARILVYEQGTIQWTRVGGIEFSIPYFSPPSAGRPANVTERGCQTRITEQDGVVRSFSFSGNTC